MEPRTANCVRKYIEGCYQGGLIGISDIADYCHVIEGELYKTFLDLQASGEVKVVKRYFCPEFHRVNPGNQTTYCESCEFTYPNSQLEVAIYIQPLESKSTR
jgi:hypothetical protein